MKKKALNKLIKLLDLETLEENLFRGQSENIGGPRVFGGQVIGQALTAAARTVPEKRFTHSLHAYFLRPGDMEYPIIYNVEGKQFVSFIATGGRYHNYKKKGSTIYTFSID